eukprot:270747_1
MSLGSTQQTATTHSSFAYVLGIAVLIMMAFLKFNIDVHLDDQLSTAMAHINYDNYQMINIWRSNFLTSSWTRIYISDTCKFVYWTTLKTASLTTRKMIDIKRCGFGHHIFSNNSWWHNTCGNRSCTQTDVEKIRNNDYFKMIFVREPIARFESVYNFLPMWYKPSTNETLDKMRFKYPHATTNELYFLEYTQYFYDYVMNGTIWRHSKYFRGGHAIHHQPLSLYACLDQSESTHKITCFIPTFVGRTETLHHDISWIRDHGIFPGNNTEHFNKILTTTHKTNHNKVERGTLYKYEDELLLMCKVYWNDFFCAHYTDKIPVQCQQMNDMVWHFPKHCVDLNGNKVLWPIPMNTY